MKPQRNNRCSPMTKNLFQNLKHFYKRFAQIFINELITMVNQHLGLTRLLDSNNASAISPKASLAIMAGIVKKAGRFNNDASVVVN